MAFVVFVGDGGVGTYRWLFLVGALEFGDYGGCELLDYGFFFFDGLRSVLTGDGQAGDHVILW